MSVSPRAAATLAAVPPSASTTTRPVDVVSRLHAIREQIAHLADELRTCAMMPRGLRRHDAVAQVEFRSIIDTVDTATNHIAALEETIDALRLLNAAQPVNGMYVVRNERVEVKQWFDDDPGASSPAASYPPSAVDEPPTVADESLPSVGSMGGAPSTSQPS
jgi:hypothetical protein